MTREGKGIVEASRGVNQETGAGEPSALRDKTRPVITFDE